MHKLLLGTFITTSLSCLFSFDVYMKVVALGVLAMDPWTDCIKGLHIGTEK